MQNAELPSEPEELRFVFDRALDALRADPAHQERKRTLAVLGLSLGEKLWTLRRDRTSLEELLATSLVCIEALRDYDLLERWALLCARVEPVGAEAREGLATVERWRNTTALLHPLNHEARLLLSEGLLFEARGELPAALDRLDRSFKLNLTRVLTLWSLARVSERLGDLDRASKSLRALLLQRLDASSPCSKADVYTKLGSLYFSTDPPKARTLFERALEAQANHREAKELLERLKKA